MTDLLRIAELSVEARAVSGEWRQTLFNCNVSIQPGEVVAFIGESGAGKTTLALSALGYARPGTRFSGGSVHFEGRDILSLSRPERRRLRGSGVAYVAQSASAGLNPAMKIGAQVEEALNIHHVMSGRAARERVFELLGLLQLPSPAELVDRYPPQISGGQQQRVILAMAMACLPRLLVLDEPTTALDVTTQIEVLHAIKDVIRAHRTAAIYVSHDLSVVAQVADRILVLLNGRIVEEAPAEDLLSKARHTYTRSLIAAVNRKPVVQSRRQSVVVSQSKEQPRGEPVLRVNQISASYQRRLLAKSAPRAAQVLHEVSFELHQNEVLAVVGESGSGKSTLVRVLAGLHSPEDGNIELAGTRLRATAAKRSRENLRRIQIIFQSPELSLNPMETVEKAIARPLKFYFGMNGSQRRDRIAALLRMVELSPDLMGRLPRELSGGQRQRVSIARAFAAEPDVILCDEMLSALDTVVAARVLELMRELREKNNVSYLFISHDLSTVATIADRVAVMYAGQLLEIGQTEDVFRPPNHPYTDLLVQSVPELSTTWLEGLLRSPPEALATGETRLHDFGCPFRVRCPMAAEDCEHMHSLPRHLSLEHSVACHRMPIRELA